MAGWSMRREGVVQDGLTVYQLQELIRTGKLGPEDEAAQDGEWRPIRQHPVLARFLPEAAAAPPKPGDFISVHGVSLRVGADGKPLPPDAATIAELLGGSPEDREAAAASTRQVRRLLRVLLAGVVGVGLFVVFRLAQIFWGSQ